MDCDISPSVLKFNGIIFSMFFKYVKLNIEVIILQVPQVLLHKQWIKMFKESVWGPDKVLDHFIAHQKYSTAKQNENY